MCSIGIHQRQDSRSLDKDEKDRIGSLLRFSAKPCLFKHLVGLLPYTHPTPRTLVNNILLPCGEALFRPLLVNGIRPLPTSHAALCPNILSTLFCIRFVAVHARCVDLANVQPECAIETIKRAVDFEGKRSYGPATTLRLYLNHVSWELQYDGTILGPEFQHCNILTDGSSSNGYVTINSDDNPRLITAY